MTIIVIGAAAVIAVIIIAVLLTRRDPPAPGSHRRRDALAAWADEGYGVSDDTIAGDIGYGYIAAPAADEDEQYTQFLAAMERPDEIARDPEPVPALSHEEYLHAAPLAVAAGPLDEFMAVPEADASVSPRRVPGRVLRSLRPGRARSERLELPPMLAPAAGVAASLAAMAQQVAANEHREVARLRTTVGALEGEILRLRNKIDFPDLADELFTDWPDWETDSGIMRRLTKEELAGTAVPA